MIGGQHLYAWGVVPPRVWDWEVPLPLPTPRGLGDCPPPPARPSRALACKQGVLGLRGEVGWWGEGSNPAFNRKMCAVLSDGHCQQLHVVGAVATISVRLGHHESICTSSAMCGRAAESVSAAAGSLAAVAAHLLLCPLSPLFQAWERKK